MKAIVLMFVLIIFININFATAEPMEKNYGIVNAWFDGEEATVENIQLEVGEPIEIKVDITSKINGYISLKLTNPLLTESYKVVSGPSNIDEWIDISNIESGWTNTYIWVIEPTAEWTSGNAPIDIFVEFGTTYNDDEHYKFTIANPYILDEQYSGPAHTRTDPSSTDLPPSQGSPGFGVVVALMGIMLAVGYRFGKN